MADRRMPAPRADAEAPSRHADETPDVSGEYRVLGERKRPVQLRRRSGTNIEAVRPPTAPTRTRQELPALELQGRVLDDELAFDLEDSSDLDIPLMALPRSQRYELPPPAPLGPSQKAHAYSPRTAPDAPAPGSRRGAALQTIDQHDPHDTLLAFAKFGPPPATIWAAPAYARHVMKRRRVLERELFDARRRRSPDVALYEAALRTADTGAVRTGVTVMCAVAALALLLVIAVAQAISAAIGP